MKTDRERNQDLVFHRLSSRRVHQGDVCKSASPGGDFDVHRQRVFSGKKPLTVSSSRHRKGSMGVQRGRSVQILKAAAVGAIIHHLEKFRIRNVGRCYVADAHVYIKGRSRRIEALPLDANRGVGGNVLRLCERQRTR